MTNDKKQPRYAAKGSAVYDGEKRIAQCMAHVTESVHHATRNAVHIADCLNACDGAEGLTPGCVERQREYTREEIHAAGDRIRQAAIALKDKDAEIARLRAIISESCEAIGNGSTMATDASLEYMGELPNEIRRAMASKALTTESEATDELQ